MSLQELFENAENCAHLAEEAKDAPSRRRYERMHAHGSHSSKAKPGWKEK